MTNPSRFFRFLRFSFVGASTLLLYLASVYLLVEFMGLQVTLASTLMLIAAACYNYFMHYHWTFTSNAPHGMVMVRYLLMIAGAVLINALIMHFGTVLSTVHYLVIQVIAAFALFCWSLGVSSLWVFRQRS